MEELKLEQGFDEPSDKLNGFSLLLAQGLCNLKTLFVGHSFIEEICAHQLVDKEGQHVGTLEHLTVLRPSEMPNLLQICHENSQPGRPFQHLVMYQNVED